MTFREAVKKLLAAGVDSAQSDAALLFEKFAGVDAARLPLVRDESFDDPELADAIEKRCARTPIQYILGSWEFFGLDFYVSPDCLCPRPDTEISVEAAISLLPDGADFLELCTGSGCISVSLCKTRGDLTGIATDKFRNTLAVAQKNAQKHGVADRLRLVCADLFDAPDYIGERRFDAIISNPPYIPTRDIDELSEEVKKEPLAALDGGEDGLDFYRHIVSEYTKYLKKGGKVIFEIGYDQGEALKSIAKCHGYSCKIIKDLGKNDRVAVLGKNEVC
ncbi:MAG: peptide chain release factor N(5)-glutamine methyltransferase [Clostridia bacterium]|nr:peptide chain release factor N(5)-glutamine methyltransferase [Clostridia bacterium]